MLGLYLLRRGALAKSMRKPYVSVAMPSIVIPEQHLLKHGKSGCNEQADPAFEATRIRFSRETGGPGNRELMFASRAVLVDSSSDPLERA